MGDLGIAGGELSHGLGEGETCLEVAFPRVDEFIMHRRAFEGFRRDFDGLGEVDAVRVEHLHGAEEEELAHAHDELAEEAPPRHEEIDDGTADLLNHEEGHDRADDPRDDEHPDFLRDVAHLEEDRGEGVGLLADVLDDLFNLGNDAELRSDEEQDECEDDARGHHRGLAHL